MILLQLSAKLSKLSGKAESEQEDLTLTQELDESCNLFVSGLKVKQRSRDINKKSEVTRQVIDFDQELQTK